MLISDEIYRSFNYTGDFHSAAEFNPDALVIDGFSKTYSMTGWRLGYAHGPKVLLEQMIKLQQITFVCAPSIVQHAGLMALDVDMNAQIDIYRRRRDRVLEALGDLFEIEKPGGAFYVFPNALGNRDAVCGSCDSQQSFDRSRFAFRRDTHFRLSYAVRDEILDRGLKPCEAWPGGNKQGGAIRLAGGTLY